MNKILSYTYCDCCNDDTLLRIVAGNDFTLRLTLSYKENDEIKYYDLDEVEDMVVNIVSGDGDRIGLDSFIDYISGKIIAPVDAQLLEPYITYSVEVIWNDEVNDKRAVAPRLFKFVDTSQEANEAQDIIISGPYDYNLIIENDIAYVSIGEIPGVDLTDYYTKEQIDDTLSSYVSNDTIDDILSSYVTYSYLETALSNVEVDLSSYVTETELDTALSSYVSNDAIDDILSSYVTYSYLETALSNVEVDLSSYVTETELDTALNSYAAGIKSKTELIGVSNIVNRISLTNSLGNTISSTDIAVWSKYITAYGWEVRPNSANGLLSKNDITKLYNIEDIVNDLQNAGYITSYDLSELSYVDSTTLYNILSSYVSNDTIDEILSSYVTYSYLETALSNVEVDLSSYVDYEQFDNTNEAIAYELLNNKTEHYDINSKFGYYYTKTEADTRYATQSWAKSNFVLALDNENQNEAIAYAISYLSENIGTGGGVLPDLSSYVSYDALDDILSSYVSNDTIDDILSSYVSNDTIDDILSSYVTYSYLETAISNVEVDLSSYVTEAELDNTLSSYATEAYVMNAIANIPSGGGGSNISYEYLAYSYYSKQEIDSQQHATAAVLDRILNTYVSNDTIDDILSSYVTYSYFETALSNVEVDLSSYVSSSTISKIWTGTEVEYNNIQVKDAYTLYIIK